MKPLGNLIVLALVASAVGACAGRAGPKATAEASAPAQAMVEVTASGLRVHATPSTTGAVVGSLKRGDRLAAPQPEADGWLYVESATGTKGYVASRYVRALDASATPAPAESAPKPAAAAAPAVSPAATGTRSAPPPPGSKLARITDGMSEAQVVEILGAPTSQQGYVTGKAWIPFYYGPDTSRVDYRYKGLGIVVFGRNRYSGATRVIRVDYDPNEDGYP